MDDFSKDFLGETSKGAAEGVMNAVLGKIGAFAHLLFPNKMDEKDAIEFFKDAVKNNPHMSIAEKTYYIANATDFIKTNNRRLQIAEKAHSIIIESGCDLTKEQRCIENDEEWFERFFDNAKFVSKDELQVVWANVLAQKVIGANDIPKSITRILVEMSAEQAHAMQMISNMQVVIFRLDDKGDFIEVGTSIFVPETKNELSEFGIDINMLEELEALGVLKVAPYAYDEDSTIGMYYNHRIIKPFNLSEEGRLPIGNVKLTQAGFCLTMVSEKTILEGYLEKVKDYLESHFIYIQEESLVIEDCDKIFEAGLFQKLVE